jgi:hypothetical protein
VERLWAYFLSDSYGLRQFADRNRFNTAIRRFGVIPETDVPKSTGFKCFFVKYIWSAHQPFGPAIYGIDIYAANSPHGIVPGSLSLLYTKPKMSILYTPLRGCLPNGMDLMPPSVRTLLHDMELLAQQLESPR